MKYSSIKRASFIKRPNRFISHVLVDGKEEIVHVKNTGRCKEILKEGTTVVLEEAKNPARKTGYSLIAAYKDELLINIDSQIPNAVVYEGILQNKIKEVQNLSLLKREVTYNNSRFDLYFEGENQKGFIEVKGVTLEIDGVAMFPDAPTERGCKHIYEMIHAVEEGYYGVIFFLIQMKGCKYLTPNELQDPKFAKALREAKEKGVLILAYDTEVKEDEIIIGEPIDVLID